MSNASELKRKLSDSWDQIKEKYPVVVSADAVATDPVKVDFIHCIDGLKSSEEIQRFFTLSPSEAHLIFSDLMNLGAIRFLDDRERMAYLKRHAVELEKNLEFIRAERERLKGEAIYLDKQLREKKSEVDEYKTKIPGLEDALKHRTENLEALQTKSVKLWDENAELFGIAKDIKHKTEVIRDGLRKLENEFPKIMKKKTKVVERFKKSDEMRHTGADKKKKIEKRLFEYHDALGEVRDYLEDTKLRVKHFRDQD